MNTALLARVRWAFNSEWVDPSINRRNRLAWIRAVRMLGDKWVLANPQRKEVCQ